MLLYSLADSQILLAGNYGSGKRGGGVSTLICAVLDDRRATDDDDEPKYAFAQSCYSCIYHLSASRYSTFVRIGSGLSFADFVWVRDKPWKKWDPKHPPEFLLTAKRSHEDKGDVYLEPKEYVLLVLEGSRSDCSISSFILKVKAAEIVPSGWPYSTNYLNFLDIPPSLDQYDMAFTMRFPRALAIRDDLSIADCMTATGSYVDDNVSR